MALENWLCQILNQILSFASEGRIFAELAVGASALALGVAGSCNCCHIRLSNMLLIYSQASMNFGL